MVSSMAGAYEVLGIDRRLNLRGGKVVVAALNKGGKEGRLGTQINS